MPAAYEDLGLNEFLLAGESVDAVQDKKLIGDGKLTTGDMSAAIGILSYQSPHTIITLLGDFFDTNTIPEIIYRVFVPEYISVMATRTDFVVFAGSGYQEPNNPGTTELEVYHTTDFSKTGLYSTMNLVNEIEPYSVTADSSYQTVSESNKTSNQLFHALQPGMNYYAIKATGTGTGQYLQFNNYLLVRI